MSNVHVNGYAKTVKSDDENLREDAQLIKHGVNGTEFTKQRLVEVHDEYCKDTDSVVYNDQEHINSASPSGLPVDRGWSWVVLLASSVNFGIVVGIYRTFGILFKEIQIKYGSSSSQTALITSMLNAGFSISSLLVTTIGLRYVSSRQLVIAGGVVLSISYMLAAFAPSIGSLIVLLGCFGGIAQGLILCPTTTLLSYYFDKRRSLAQGLAVTGASVGTLIFSVIIRVFIEQYTISGTMIIIAGIALNMVVSGCLMRPPSFYDKLVLDDVVTHVDLKQEVIPEAKEDCNTSIISSENHFQNEAKQNKVVSPLHEQQMSPLMARAILSRRRRNRTISEISKLSLVSAIGSTLNTSHIGRYASTELPYSSIIDVRGSNTTVNKSNIKKEDNRTVNDNTTTCCLFQSKILGKMASIMDCSVIKRTPFLVFLPCACLITTLSNIQVFLPPFAIDAGLSGRQSDTLITIMSTVEMVSLVACGYFADKQIISRHKIIAICVLAISLTTFFAPLFEAYGVFIAFSAWYGLYSRVYFGLLPVVLVDFLGMENLGSAVGITTMVQTAFAAFLQPIIGLLRDNFHSYIPGFLFIASALLCGGLGVLTLPFVARCERRNKQKKKGSTPA